MSLETAAPVSVSPADDLARRILEANARFYDEHAEEYESFQWYFRNAWEQRMWTRDVQGLCEAVRMSVGRPPEVLDLGCGTGHLTRKFLQAGARVTAVDVSERMVERLEARVDPRDRERLFAVCGEAGAFLAGTRGRFDIVAEASVLHHVLDMEALVAGMAGAVRPGGYLYLTREPLGASDARPSGIGGRAVHAAVSCAQAAALALRRERLAKAPDHRLAAYHYYGGGVSPRALRRAALRAGLHEVYEGRFNRRVAGWASRIENGLLGRWRIDRPRYTFFTQCFRREAP